MKAYLIDPAAKTVTETDWNGDFRHIYELIDAQAFDIARLTTDGDSVYVDDEGLINGTAHKVGLFEVEGYSVPLAGKGLVLGHNGSGESIEPRMSLADLTARVTFPTVEAVQARAMRGEFD